MQFRLVVSGSGDRQKVEQQARDLAQMLDGDGTRVTAMTLQVDGQQLNLGPMRPDGRVNPDAVNAQPTGPSQNTGLPAGEPGVNLTGTGTGVPGTTVADSGRGFERGQPANQRSAEPLIPDRSVEQTRR